MGNRYPWCTYWPKIGTCDEPQLYSKMNEKKRRARVSIIIPRYFILPPGMIWERGEPLPKILGDRGKWGEGEKDSAGRRACEGGRQGEASGRPQNGPQGHEPIKIGGKVGERGKSPGKGNLKDFGKGSKEAGGLAWLKFGVNYKN